MTPDEAIREARSGALRPVYLVMGEERLLVDRVLGALREAAMRGGIPGFNEDKFTAGEARVDTILSAAKMVPMMGPRRLVLVRGVERWEAKNEEEDEGGGGRGAREGSPLDQLAEYAKAPVPSTALVLVATKLHGQRRLVTAAKKGQFLVACDPISRRDLPGWIEEAVRAKGHRMEPGVAELLAEVAGSDLSYVSDALERLALYVGPGAVIGEAAVASVVTRVTQSTVWELIDAISARRTGRALGALSEVFDPRDGGLRLLGAVWWSVRQMVKFDLGLRAGMDPAEAGQRAGVAPFKIRELAQVLRALPRGTMESWLRLLAEADLALKGSKRPAQAVLETMVIAMCR